jgi:hypothetical protein
VLEQRTLLHILGFIIVIVSRAPPVSGARKVAAREDTIAALPTSGSYFRFPRVQRENALKLYNSQVLLRRPHVNAILDK